MIGKIKALGLAVAAMAAIAAMAASSAQAGEFDLGTQPSVVTAHDEASQDHLVTLQETDGGQAATSCTTAALEGTSQGQTLNEGTVTPTYGGQCLFNGISSQDRMNGCKFTFTGAGQPANTYLLDLVGCTNATTGATISVPGCQFRIPEQNGISHVVASNIGGKPHEVTLEATAANITVHQVGIGCPDGNGHKATNGAITGNTILKAFQDVGGQQVTEHGHQFVKLQAGTQVDITST